MAKKRTILELSDCKVDEKPVNVNAEMTFHGDLSLQFNNIALKIGREELMELSLFIQEQVKLWQVVQR